MVNGYLTYFLEIRRTDARTQPRHSVKKKKQVSTSHLRLKVLDVKRKINHMSAIQQHKIQKARESFLKFASARGRGGALVKAKVSYCVYYLERKHFNCSELSEHFTLRTTQL